MADNPSSNNNRNQDNIATDGHRLSRCNEK